MNLRKFYLIISITLALFLSVSGIVIVSNLNAAAADTVQETDEPYTPELNLDDVTTEPGSTNDSPIKPKPDFGELESKPITKSKPVNILIVGGDSASGNTDTILVVNFNPMTSELNILSIPRDTRVKLNDEYHKINFAYPSGGNKLIKSAIWELMGLNIDRYIFLDTSAFRDIIDVLGGVEYDVPVDMKYVDEAQNLYIDIKAGKQTLDGTKAEHFVRFRQPNTYEGLPDNYTDYYSGSDIKRINAQQSFIRELIRQKTTLSNLPRVFSVLDIIFDRVKTDFSLDEILGYSYNIDSISMERVKTFVLSGSDSIIDGIWFFEFNNALLYQGANYDAASVIQKFFKSNLEGR